MTASLISQHEAATGEPSLFDSLSRLVPDELQRELGIFVLDRAPSLGMEAFGVTTPR